VVATTLVHREPLPKTIAIHRRTRRLSQRRPALVVLRELTGSVEVAGKTYNGFMLPFGHLSDDKIDYRTHGSR